jgi:RecA/RadA recombinase
MSNTIEELKKYSIKRADGLDLIKWGSSGKLDRTYISTGVFISDFALLGGIEEGTCVTLVGQQGSGKTTLAHKITGNFQKKYDGVSRPKKYAACVELEGGYDHLWAEKNGVNTDELILAQPHEGTLAGDLLCEILSKPDVGLVVLDSIPCLVGIKEIEKSLEDPNAPGIIANILQRILRKASAIMAEASARGEKKTLVLINQWRSNTSSYGSPKILPGGKFARYYSTIELEVFKKLEKITKDQDEIDSVEYNEHSFSILKARHNCIKEGEFTLQRRDSERLMEGEIDDYDTVTTYAQKFKFVEGAGPKWQLTHPYSGQVIDFKGKKYITEQIENDPQLYADLQRKIISLQRKKFGLSEEGWY